jgi:CO/xanthine dehydrogenase FAD-binding subunit
MASILANRDLAFLHPAARIVGGPAVRAMATVGGNLFAPTPYGDFATALSALDGMVRMGSGPAETSLEEFFAARERRGLRGLVASVAVTRPASADAFRFRKVSLVKPKGISVLTIAAHLPQTSGPHRGRADRLWGARADADPRQGGRARAGRCRSGRGRDRGRHCGRGDGTQPADDALASGWYRREILPVYLKRVLLGQPS